MSKTCPQCKIKKEASDFHINNKKKDGLQNQCKECKSLNSKKYYIRNITTYLEIYSEKRTKARLDIRRKLYDYLVLHSCVDCKESDPVVLQFDHIGEKTAEVGQLLRRSVSWNKILSEIEKCEVRCANCHTRKTARDFKWYKDVFKNTAVA
mgnify:CR=1 FL=1